MPGDRIPHSALPSNGHLTSARHLMSIARPLLIGTIIIGGVYSVMKPEARQKVKSAVGKQLRILSNLLDPQGPPPMWTDEDNQPSADVPVEEPAVPDSDARLEEDDAAEEDEVRTNHGFKVIR